MPRGPRRGGGTGALVPVILLLGGFLITSALAEERRREAQLPSRTAELLRLITHRDRVIDELSREASALAARLRELQRAKAAGSERLRAALAQANELELPASMGPASGPGVIVELTDSETSPRTRGDLTDLRIQDVDLRLVVNALWRSGAEAIAINGHRVGSTTAIRTAGERILVNFDPVASPYRVTALGDPARLEAGIEESEVGEQFDVWMQVYGLGFSVRTVSELAVPALETAPSIEWARPADAGVSS